MGNRTNNPNGRPAGIPNKITGQLRTLIHSFLSDNWQAVEADFKALEPKDRLQFYEKLLSFGLPKLRHIEFTPEKTELESMSERDIEALIERVKNEG